MRLRSKGFSIAVAFALTGALCGMTAHTASAASAEDERGTSATSATAPQPGTGVLTSAAGADEICAILGIGSGAAGASKALAKGASWVGIGASIGCYWYSQGKKATPAEKRAVMLKSYKNYQAKSSLGKLEALGYSCRKKDEGGGGGTDSASVEPMAGYRTITMKGVDYTCGNIRD